MKAEVKFELELDARTVDLQHQQPIKPDVEMHTSLPASRRLVSHDLPTAMSTASRALSKLKLGLTAAFGVYAVLLGVLLTPRMQRL